MVPVENPSELLLSTRARNVPGSCVHCAIEGSRPMLVDVQALALQTAYGTPRRTTNGFDAGRLALLLAVLEKRAGVSLFNQDVYINVAGGPSCPNRRRICRSARRWRPACATPACRGIGR